MQSNGTTWTGAIYRLGWYQDTGARLIASIPQQTGVAQGSFDGITLNNCPTAISDSTTHLLEAGWASSYNWSVPANATTGVHLAQFTDQNGKQTYCSFVVRGNHPADYAYIRPTTTDAAYNNWGGWHRHQGELQSARLERWSYEVKMVLVEECRVVSKPISAPFYVS